MKKHPFLLCFLLCFLLISSCSSKKSVLLLQNSDNLDTENFTYEEILIKPNDILKITVRTLSEETSILYNNIISTGIAASSPEMLKLQGYLVDIDGNINFPVLGKVNVVDKSTNEIENLIYKLLLDGNQLTDHTVHVRLLNARITVIGDVKRPGTYNFFENHINIFQAISLSGGLEITANRKNIKIIREVDNKRNTFDVDLTSGNLVSSDYYLLKNNDIIIVNPNNTKVKNAGIIGNSGTLISLLSFILSSIIVIQN